MPEDANDPIEEAIGKIEEGLRDESAPQEPEPVTPEDVSPPEEEVDEPDPADAVDEVIELDDEGEEVVEEIDPSLKVLAAINDVDWEEVERLWQVDPALARAKARGERIGGQDQPTEHEPQPQPDEVQQQASSPAEPSDEDQVIEGLVEELANHLDRETAEALAGALKKTLVDKYIKPTAQQQQQLRQYVEAINQQRALEMIDNFVSSVGRENADLYGPGGLAHIDKKTPEQKRRIQSLAETAEVIMAARSRSGRPISPQEALQKAHEVILMESGKNRKSSQASRRKKQMSLRGRKREPVAARVNGAADPAMQKAYDAIAKWAEERGVDVT